MIQLLWVLDWLWGNWEEAKSSDRKTWLIQGGAVYVPGNSIQVDEKEL